MWVQRALMRSQSEFVLVCYCMMVTCSSTYSLSVPLSVVETSLRTQTAPSGTAWYYLAVSVLSLAVCAANI